MFSLLADAQVLQDPLWFRTLNLPILSASLGAAIALLGVSLNEWAKQRREVRRVASSLSAEITSITRMLEHSHFFKGLDDTIEAMTNNRKADLFATWLTGDIFKTYSSNPTSTGTLPADAAKEVAYFYSLAFSVFERLKALNAKADQHADLSQVGVLGPLMYHKALRTSTKEMMNQADKAIAALAKLLPKSKP